MPSKPGALWRETKRRIPDGEFGPWVALAAGIIEQAALDVKRMQKEGVILPSGEVTESWPKSDSTCIQYAGKNKRFNGFRKEHEVTDLLHFFTRGGADDLLSALGYDLDSKRIRKAMNI